MVARCTARYLEKFIGERSFYDTVIISLFYQNIIKKSKTSLSSLVNFKGHRCCAYARLSVNFRVEGLA